MNDRTGRVSLSIRLRQSTGTSSVFPVCNYLAMSLTPEISRFRPKLAEIARSMLATAHRKVSLVQMEVEEWRRPTSC